MCYYCLAYALIAKALYFAVFNIPIEFEFRLSAFYSNNIFSFIFHIYFLADDAADGDV